MIKAVIFDMDGVLIDAKEWHYEALNRALGLFGAQINRFDHLTTFDGLPTRRKLEILSQDGVIPAELHEFINEMKQIYTMEIVYERCRPTFIHEYALSILKSDGYLLAVASNSIRRTVETMMERADLCKYLDLTLSNEDVAQSKPDPEIYQKAMRQLNVLPHECLIVEDNEHGIRAALASGGHVMEVGGVEQVNLENIRRQINICNKASC